MIPALDRLGQAIARKVCKTFGCHSDWPEMAQCGRCSGPMALCPGCGGSYSARDLSACPSCGADKPTGSYADQLTAWQDNAQARALAHLHDTRITYGVHAPEPASITGLTHADPEPEPAVTHDLCAHHPCTREAIGDTPWCLQHQTQKQRDR